MRQRQHGIPVAVRHVNGFFLIGIGKIPRLQHALLRPCERDGDGHLAVKIVNFRSVCCQAHIERLALHRAADDCGLIATQCVVGADMQLNISAVRHLDDRLHRSLVQRDHRVRHLD